MKVVLAVALVSIVVLGAFYLNQPNLSPNGAPTAIPYTAGDNPPVFAAELPNSTEAVSTASVAILYGSFVPSAIRVSTGATVTWENQDGVIHSIAAIANSRDNFTSGIIGGRQMWSYAFNQSGTYYYFDGTTQSAQGVVYVQ